MSLEEIRTAIGTLEEVLGLPVVLLTSSWRADRAVNLDRESARIVVDVVEAMELGDDPLAIFVEGEGGYAGFADMALRALRGPGRALTAVVAHRVQSAFSVLALGADEILVHPYGGVGAYDAGLIGECYALPGGASTPAVAAPGGSEKAVRHQLQHALRQRHLLAMAQRKNLSGRSPRARDAILAELNHERLGEELALSAPELDALEGLAARRVAADSADLIWELYRQIEDRLELRGEPRPRYTASDLLADEVEFEPALGVDGALFVGGGLGYAFELDTGSPDPDTGLYRGDWRPL